jgi:hypothetical protein
VKKQTGPPPSRYPRIADGTLARVDQLAMKNAPPFNYAPYRFTSDAQPRVTGTFTTLVPQVGADGNELSLPRPLHRRLPAVDQGPLRRR